MSDSNPKQAEPLRLLCFGDSLTEGYSRFGLIMTPYSQSLKTELEVKLWAWKERRKVDVVTDGESGDLVTTGSFKDRMSDKCALCSFAKMRLILRDEVPSGTSLEILLVAICCSRLHFRILPRV